MNSNLNNPIGFTILSGYNLSERRIAQKNSHKNDKRIVIIDILRGFALFGVLMVHLVFSFSGWSFLSYEKAILLPLSQFDTLVSEVVKFFFSNKFRGIFSFLFGLSFSIQMVRSIEKGIPYKKVFYKRMAILLLFGIVHSYLFWRGDILRWYVIAGLILLLIHKWKSKNLLIAGIFFSTIFPIFNNILKKFTGDISYPLISNEGFFQAMSGSSYSELLYGNFLFDFEHNFNLYYRLSFLMVILGQFMLGFWAGRNNVFKKHEYYRPIFKKMFWLGLILGIGGTGTVHLLKYLNAAEYIHLPSYVKMAMEVPDNIGIMTLALSYICGITLLHEKPFWKNKLALFIPVGRMALTNYIMQSIICIAIFYGIGFGLAGMVSLIFILPLCLIIFGFQIVFSHMWLNKFHSGPLEWIWRSLMFGKKQPFLKNKSIIKKPQIIL